MAATFFFYPRGVGAWGCRRGGTQHLMLVLGGVIDLREARQLRGGRRLCGVELGHASNQIYEPSSYSLRMVIWNRGVVLGNGDAPCCETKSWDSGSLEDGRSDEAIEVHVWLRCAGCATNLVRSFKLPLDLTSQLTHLLHYRELHFQPRYPANLKTKERASACHRPDSHQHMCSHA